MRIITPNCPRPLKFEELEIGQWFTALRINGSIDYRVRLKVRPESYIMFNSDGTISDSRLLDSGLLKDSGVLRLRGAGKPGEFEIIY